MTLRALVINLDDSTERLAAARASLAAAGFELERLPAADMRGRPPTAAADYDDSGARGYMGRSLRGGEVGCYLSHLEAARRIAQDRAPFGLVFEDDVAAAPGSAQAVAEVLRWLERSARDWDMVHLGANKMKYFTPLHRLSAFGPGVAAHDLVAAHYFPMTTSALLWSRAGAARFVAGWSRIRMPVDNALREGMTRSGRGYAVWPPLAWQSGAASDIDGATTRRKIGGRTWNYGYLKQRRLMVNKTIALRRQLAEAARRKDRDPA